MHHPKLKHLAPLLALLPACAIERLEAFLEEHGQTYVTTDAQASSTSTADTTTTTTTSTSNAASTDADADGPDTTSDPDTTTTSSSSTTDTTGDPPPVCGNGVLEPFGSLPEECDDGNLIADDGCGATCAADLTIFVSSNLYEAGYFESLYLADAVCANMAVQVGFPQPLKFRAWLSDSTTNARDHFKKIGRGRIVLVNGLVVADSWTDLLAGNLQSPIEVTEQAQTYHGPVWTGTTPQGVLVPGATNCDDWTSFSDNKAAYYGYSDRTTAEWTLSTSFDNPYGCIGNFAVYCLEER